MSDHFATLRSKGLRIVLLKKAIILMMSAKMATPSFLKIKVFWNKVYDVIIYAHVVTYKILSRDDVVIWPKFGNSSISMREVIITSTLYQKIHFFEGCYSWSKFDKLGQKVLGVISYAYRSYWSKTDRGLFDHAPILNRVKVSFPII